MFGKQLLATRTNRKATAAEPAERLCFNSDKIIAAIAFHLVDEGIALSVDTDSIPRTTDRLRRLNLHPTVNRLQWAEMTNEQRLTWLLVEGRTCVVLSGGVATLSPLSSQPMIAA